MKSPKDPVDHARTTRPHAGESMTDTKNMPALTGLAFIAIAAAGFVVGLAWLAVEHRRVRNIEERWYAEHPAAHRQWPSS